MSNLAVVRKQKFHFSPINFIVKMARKKTHKFVFFFFLFPFFSFCLSFSSLPLLFDILKPKKVPTRWGLWHKFVTVFWDIFRLSGQCFDLVALSNACPLRDYRVAQEPETGTGNQGNGRNTVSGVLLRKRELTEFCGKLGEFHEKLGEFTLTHK